MALLAVIAMVVVACGSGDPDTADTTAADTPATDAAPEPTEGDTGTTEADTEPTDGGTETTEGASGETREVTVALSTTSVFGYGYWIALDQGFYAEENLDVELQGTGGSSDVAQILASNSAEAGMGVPGAMLPAIEAGADLYPFFTYAYGEVFDVVVPEDSELQEIAELEGGVLGISELAGGEVPLARALLVEAGLDPDSDLQIIEVGTDAPSIQNALDQGRIDAYSGAKADIAAMSAVGLATRSIAPESLATLPAEGLLATADTKDDVDLLGRIGRATAKGQLVAYTNFDAAVCSLKNQIPEEFTDDAAGRESLESVIAITTAPTADDGSYEFGFLDAEGWNTYVEIFIQGGVISNDIDMSEYVIADALEIINDFDQQAVAELADGLPTDC